VKRGWQDFFEARKRHGVRGIGALGVRVSPRGARRVPFRGRSAYDDETVGEIIEIMIGLGYGDEVAAVWV
jgi:hypothetical protein